MSLRKQLWVLAGGNGAGKSTFYRTQLQKRGLPLVNADVIARELYPQAPEEQSYSASRVAADIRQRLVTEGRTFCFETVFSHPSKIDFLGTAKALGYEIIMVFIHLQNASLNKARVSQRVVEGGHDVPETKIEARIPRTLLNIRRAIPLCDHVRALDNSSALFPFQPIFTLRSGVLEAHVQTLPQWAESLLE